MDFSPAAAKLTVELCRLAYMEPAPAASGTAARGLGEFRHFDAGASTQAFIANDPAARYLAFRGTQSDNPRDWLTDSRFGPRASTWGRVHSGFDAALDEVWAEMLAALASDPRPLTITGHSLGGGLAILAAARLAAANTPPAAVYVFGCPRVGLADFRHAYDAALRAVTFRVINHIDLVTRVPLLIQGYRAPGRRMYFDGSHRFHPDAGAWHIATDDLGYRLAHWGRIESIGLNTHSVGAYIARVESL